MLIWNLVFFLSFIHIAVCWSFCLCVCGLAGAAFGVISSMEVSENEQSFFLNSIGASVDFGSISINLPQRSAKFFAMPTQATITLDVCGTGKNRLHTTSNI